MPYVPAGCNWVGFRKLRDRGQCPRSLAVFIIAYVIHKFREIFFPIAHGRLHSRSECGVDLLFLRASLQLIGFVQRAFARSELRHPGFQCGPVGAGGIERAVEPHARQFGGVHHLSDRHQRGCGRVLLQLGQRGGRMGRSVGVAGRPDGSGGSERVTEFVIGPEQRIGIRPSPHEQAGFSPVGAAFQPRRSRLKASPTRFQSEVKNLRTGDRSGSARLSTEFFPVIDCV